MASTKARPDDSRRMNHRRHKRESHSSFEMLDDLAQPAEVVTVVMGANQQVKAARAVTDLTQTYTSHRDRTAAIKEQRTASAAHQCAVALPHVDERDPQSITFLIIAADR